MRQRLVVVIVGAVVAAVVAVGLGTLVLAVVDARRGNEDDLARRLDELAAVVAEVRPARTGLVVRRLAPTLDADSVQLVRLDAAAPASGPLDEGDLDRLRDGETVTRRDGGQAHAAAPLPPPGGGAPNRALLATDSIDADLGSAGRWFLVVGAATIVLGALLAVRLAGSLAGPLAQAEAATRRIAEGDLAARVPEPPGAAADDDELARLVRSINQMATALERSRRTERDFLLSVSHDLRTPLTSISGWAEALSDGTAPDARAAGGTILTEAQRLDRLVRDLLDLARLRARSFTLALEPTDLRDIAAGVAEGLRPDLEDAGLQLLVEVPPDRPVVVQADPDRLAQVAGNLIENAGRHAGTTVRVSIRDDPTHAVLAVDDDGPGIDPDERDRIFDRLHTGRGPRIGTGLGLAIVRELVNAMQGEVHATDAPPDLGGARLVVRLPLPGTIP